MSARACIAQLTADGQIDETRAARFLATLDDLEQSYRSEFGEASAAELASRETVARLEAEAADNRRQKLLQLSVQRGILSGLAKHMEGGGKAGQYALALLDHHEAVPGVANISNRHAALRDLAWTKMGDFLNTQKRNIIGLPREANLRNIARERFGVATGDVAAKELADAFGDTAEWLRQHFNAAGGHIGKLDGWGLPQAHNSVEVARAGFATWAAFIRPLLAPERMLDGATGKPFTAAGLDDALRASWLTIASEGLDKMEPGQIVGSKVANRRADHRFFVFRDADAWLAYQDRFGTGDVYNAITGHIDGMAKDIAAMQVLGPNPGLTVRWLGDVLKKNALPTIEGGKDAKLEKSAGKTAKAILNMWRMYTGELTMPDPTDRSVARFFSGLRNWNVATKLGSAFLSAAGTDPVFLSFTAKFNGLPVTKTLGTYLKGFNPASAESREAAARAGIIVNELVTRTEKLWLEGERRLNVHEVSRRLGEGVMRASLLAPHTQASKQALGLAFMAELAAQRGSNFDGLNKGLRLGLLRYGIDAASWDAIRATKPTVDGGMALLRPGDVANRQDIDSAAATNLALRLFEMIDSETRFGTPGESLRARTAVATLFNSIEAKRGTLGGEFYHSATQFKTYSVIALLTHFQRAMYGNGGMSRASWAAMLPLFLTFGGVTIVSLKDIRDGKSPPSLRNPDTWVRGMFQGGGLGLAGDFVQAGLGGKSRTGGNFAGFIAGPTLSTFVDPSLNLILGNIGDLKEGRTTNAGREAASAVANNVPGSSLWYGKLAFQRLALDNLQRMADPEADAAFARMQRRAEAEYGQSYWWAPGETAPDASPDFQNAFEEAPQ